MFTTPFGTPVLPEVITSRYSSSPCTKVGAAIPMTLLVVSRPATASVAQGDAWKPSLTTSGWSEISSRGLMAAHISLNSCDPYDRGTGVRRSPP